MPPVNEIKRDQNGPPKSAEVKNWPYPQYAQTEDIAKNKYINQKVHGMATSVLHMNDEFGRTNSAPKAAEVANWPYPQFAQTEDIAKNKYINQKVHGMATSVLHMNDEFGRAASAPK